MRQRIRRFPRVGLLQAFGRRLNLLDFDGHPRRNSVKQDGDVVIGLYVDVTSAELKVRLASAVAILDKRIEDIATRAEGGALTYEDLETSHGYVGADMDDLSDMPPKKLKAAVRRRLSHLNDAKTQVQFLRDHVIEGITYRLDAEDARRLATLHCDVD